MNRLPAVAVCLAVTLFCGCASVEQERLAETSGPVPAHIVGASTVELSMRRTQVYDTILEIQRQVEMKAGLHMGVAIHDDRAKLAGLYKEARLLDRELLRRYNSGDGAARVETVKAVY
jgi:hypothetical protein